MYLSPKVLFYAIFNLTFDSSVLLSILKYLYYEHTYLILLYLFFSVYVYGKNYFVSANTVLHILKTKKYYV